MRSNEIAPEKITELDVRPILRDGGEPFSEIMAAIQRVAPDGALRLRATFKPTPLFRVLGMQGWQNEVEYGEGDDWVILFYREGAAPEGITQAELRMAHLCKANPELQSRLKADGNTWTIDVRTLSPPEPMELTLFVLEKLPEGVELVQVNERVPQFLLPILEDRGFGYEILRNDEEVHLRIRRV